MDYFSALPEDCMSDIISRTSPLDAIRSSLISSRFKPAADSDTVWEKFLPSDYQDIIARSPSPVVYTSMKDLYLRLCYSPILLDQGNMIFSLHKKSGKKCFMLGARKLMIVWGNTPCYWKWTPHPDSRFSEVAELLYVTWLDIRARIKTQMLSSKTIYVAYLVFNFTESSYGLDSANATIRFVNHETEPETEDKARTVRLWPPTFRMDGWMEIDLWKFYNDQGDDGEVEPRLLELVCEKSGLIVEGIEFRPEEGP